MLEQNRTNLGSNETVASMLNAYLFNNRDLMEFNSFEEKLKALNIDAVNASLRKYFDTKKLVMVYGGDFEKGKTDATKDKKGF